MRLAPLILVVAVLPACTTQPATTPVASSTAQQLRDFDDGGGLPQLAYRNQLEPAVAQGSTEWLVVWSDLRNARSRGSDIYGARVSFDGGIVDPQGFAISTAPGDQDQPRVGFDGTNYRVAWHDGLTFALATTEVTPGAVVVDPNGVSLRASVNQSMEAVAGGPGLSLVMWREPNLTPHGLIYGPNGPAAFAYPATLDSASTTSAVWNGSTFRLGWASGPSMFTATVDQTGTVSAITTLDTNITLGTFYVTHAAVAPDGTALITWKRNTPGQILGTVWGALVPGDGTPPADAGFRLASGVGQINGVTSSWLGNAFVTAYSTAPNDGFDTVSRLVSLDGGVGPEVTVTDAGSGLSSPISAGSLLVVGEGNARGDEDLAFVFLTPQGQASRARAVLTRSSKATETPALTGNGGDELMLVWSEHPAATSRDIWLRRFSLTDGDTLDAPTKLSNLPGDEANPRVAFGGASWWVGWLDETTQIAQVAEVGTNLTVLRSTSLPWVNQLDLVKLPGGGAQLATAGLGEIKVARLPSPDGGIIGALDTLAGNAIRPRIAANASDRYVVAYTGTHPTYTEVRAAAKGTGFITVCPVNLLEPLETDVASDGTRFLIVWAANEKIHGSFVDFSNPDGGLASGGCGFAMSGPGPATSRRKPSVEFVNGQYLVVWEEHEGRLSPSHLQGATVTPTGHVAAVSLGLDEAGADFAPTIAGNTDSFSFAFTRLDAPQAVAPRAMLASTAGGRALGVTCATGGTCATGFCVDGVCCDTSCNAGAPDCLGCSVAVGATVDGVCQVLPMGSVCRPLAFECDRVETCSGTVDTCGTDKYVIGTPSCGPAGAGSCGLNSGLCVLPDGGVVSGPGVDAGPQVDGGGGGFIDSGVAADAGPPPDAGFTYADAGGGRTDAGAVDDAGVGEKQVSHYDWGQGCQGCSATGAMPFDFLVFGLGALGRRRSGLLAALLVVGGVGAANAAPAGQKPVMIFSGLSAGAGISEKDATAISDFIETRVAATESYQLTGPGDLKSMLGMERQRQLLGCGETSCTAELAGAFNADRLLNGSLARVGDSVLISLTLLDTRRAKAIHRVGARLKGGSLDALLDQLEPLLNDLLGRDPLAPHAATLASADAVTSSAESTLEVSLGLRVEGEMLGIAAGGAAIAPAVVFGISTGWVGGTLTVIAQPIPGVRLEARGALPGRVRPFIGLGATLFGTAFAPRGVLGVTTRLGPVILGVDGAVEYFVSGQQRFNPLAVLVSLSAAWVF